MKKAQQQARQAAKEMGKKVEKQAKAAYSGIAEKIARESSLPKDALGLSDAMVEGIYGQAYRLYNTGKYKEAIQLFRLLIMVQATEPKYSMGLAACFHMLKEFKNAIEAYALCSIIDPESPVPFFHASDCYLQMSDKFSALVALRMASDRTKGKEEFNTLRDRAQLTIQTLEKEMAKQREKG